MPRDSSGTYLLPSGNPVATDTIIESAWANNTLSDIAVAMTNSLDRFGSSTMQKELLIQDGTQAKPGLAFGSETTTGLFRKQQYVLGISINNNDVAEFSVTGAKFPTGLSQPFITDVLKLADGTLAAPALAFTSEATLGLYRQAAGLLGVAGSLRIGGAAYAGLGVRDGGAYGGTGPNANYDGIVVESSGHSGISVMTPAANNGGIAFGRPGVPYAGSISYVHASEVMQLGVNQNAVLTLAATYINCLQPVYAPSGTVAAPSYSWPSAANWGMYMGSGVIGWSVGGVQTATLNQGNLFIGSGSPVMSSGGRGLIEVTGTGSSMVALDVGAGCNGYLFATATEVRLAANLTTLPITFYANSAERARITNAGQGELCINTTSASAWSVTNRGTIAMDGTAGSWIGFASGGITKGYLAGISTSLTLSTTNTTTPILLMLNGAEVARVDTDQTFKYTGNAGLSAPGMEVGWRDLPVVAFTTTRALTGNDRAKLFNITAAANVSVNSGMWAGGWVASFVNTSGSAIQFTQGSGVGLYWNGNTGTRNLAQAGIATLTCLNGTTYFLTGSGIS